MRKTILYAIIIVSTIFILFFAAFFVWWYISATSHNSSRNPTCDVHEAKRISFQLKQTGLDLHKMIDSFQVLHPVYMIADSLAMEPNEGNMSNCICCCIDNGEDILFSKAPIEIYRINVAHQADKNQDIGYIDIVSKYENGEWHCMLTSNLDKVEKERISKRLNAEILLQLPMVTDSLLSRNRHQ